MLPPTRSQYVCIIGQSSVYDSKDYKLKSKCVTIVATKEGGIRDHVFILDTYLSKIPTQRIEKKNEIPSSSNAARIRL